ncbi:MAG TPA: S8 family serine peptidase [Trebonia sp.]|nr:S8 family serine peptidase [Trebonia sp.]
MQAMQKCFITPRDSAGAAESDEGQELAVGRALHADPDILARHGARVLDPDDVPVAGGWPAPQSTVYRARTLLLPPDLAAEASLTALNEVLARAGMRLVPRPADGHVPGSVAARVPRAAVLVPVESDGVSSPGAVDAWRALTALRAARNLAEADVQRISLEHLLVGAAITGDPIVFCGGVESGPGSRSGGIDQSYLYRGNARTPVEIALQAPPRRTETECTALYGRRPVIAVLDSGVRAHPWLDVTIGPDGGDPAKPNGYATQVDGFVQVDQHLQDVIYQDAGSYPGPGQGGQLIRYPWDAPDPSDAIIREVDSHTGHGSFVAGLIRQVVPDATVLSIRIMRSDGIVPEGDLLIALGLIADRVAAAQASGDTTGMIDAVSLSLGYFSDSAADVAYTSALRQVIDELLDMGVVVTAAAGNYTTRRRYYPAAFAGDPSAAGRVPLVSVGALNPNGTPAAFSDGGSWVHGWARGAAIVSTFPVDVNGPLDANVKNDAAQGLDPDDYTGGFAAWSGTSFSAPAMAAHLVAAMTGPLLGLAPDPTLRLDVPGAKAAIQRAEAALRQLRLPA